MTASVSCPAGKVAFGGGAEIGNTDPTETWKTYLQSTYPSSTTAWTTNAVIIVALSAGDQARLTPYVLCSL